MLITNNKKDYERARVLSLHGMDKAAWNRYGKKGYRHYDVTEIGYKYNLMDMLSAIGIIQLKKIDVNNKKREIIWQNYNKGFKKLSFKTPANFNKKIIQHSFHLYNIFINKKKDGISRDDLILELHKKKIGVGIHYRAIPEHSVYKKNFGFKLNDYPNAKKIGRETISLPLSPLLKKNEIRRVIDVLKNIFIK
jgi:dTDP-4-amino-4,6-dideoxygalactose transaminase